MLMKYKLSELEKEMVTKFDNLSIPYEFRSGKYCSYMQWFETVHFDICSSLLKGDLVEKKLYDMMLEGDDIMESLLDSTTASYYKLYLQIVEIVKKYNN